MSIVGADSHEPNHAVWRTDGKVIYVGSDCQVFLLEGG